MLRWMLRAVKGWLLIPVHLPLSWYVVMLLVTVPNVAWVAREVGTPGQAATLNMAWALPCLAIVAAFLGWAQSQVNQKQPEGDEGLPIDAMEIADESEPSISPSPAWRVVKAVQNALTRLSTAARNKPVSHALVIVAVLYMGSGLVAVGALIG
jgi:hypothetical protein